MKLTDIYLVWVQKCRVQNYKTNKKKAHLPVKSAVKSPNQSQLSSFSHVSSMKRSVGLLVLHFGPD